MTNVHIGGGEKANLETNSEGQERTMTESETTGSESSNLNSNAPPTFSCSSMYPPITTVSGSPYSFGMYEGGARSSSSYRTYGDSRSTGNRVSFNDYIDYDPNQHRQGDSGSNSDMRALASVIRELGEGGSARTGRSRVAGAVNKPQTYSGKITEDLDNFIRHFEAYAAFRFFYGLPMQTRSNYVQLKDRLKLKFNPNNLQLVNVQTLFNRKQQKNEPLETYLDGVLKLCDRAGKNPEYHFVVLIQGLRPPLKNFVMSQNVANMDMTIQAARLGDSLYPEESAAPASVHAVTAIAGSSNNIEHKIDQLCSVVVALAQAQNNQKSQPPLGPAGYDNEQYNPSNHVGPARYNNVQYDQRPQPGPSRYPTNNQYTQQTPPTGPEQYSGRPTYRNGRTTEGVIICGRCGRVGHGSLTCRTKEVDLPVQGSQGPRPRRNITCYNCGVQGHISRYCTTPSGDSDDVRLN
jgi:hypothetical protein